METPERSPIQNFRPLLEVRNLSKSYGNVPAVREVNFDVHEGEILVLLGPSGCGKSTTLRVLAGLERPDCGEIYLREKAIVHIGRGIFLSPEQRNMGMVFQNFAIWPHMSVADHVAFPLRVRHTPRRQIHRRVEELLAFVGLSGLEERRATQLSGGQQQRLALARALVYEPDVLLLDEPLSNLDAKLRQQMRVELRKLQQTLGSTFIFVTHDQIEAMTLAHRIALMRGGRIEQIGKPDDLYERPESLFVHGFLGETVNFEGKWVCQGRETYVELPGGYKLLPAAPDARELLERNSADVRVTVRPDDLRVITDHRAPRENEIEAVVENMINLGGRYEIALSGGGKEFVVEISKRMELRHKQHILLEVSPAKIKLWPR